MSFSEKKLFADIPCSALREVLIALDLLAKYHEKEYGGRHLIQLTQAQCPSIIAQTSFNTSTLLALHSGYEVSFSPLHIHTQDNMHSGARSPHPPPPLLLLPPHSPFLPPLSPSNSSSTYFSSTSSETGSHFVAYADLELAICCLSLLTGRLQVFTTMYS